MLLWHGPSARQNFVNSADYPWQLCKWGLVLHHVDCSYIRSWSDDVTVFNPFNILSLVMCWHCQVCWMWCLRWIKSDNWIANTKCDVCQYVMAMANNIPQSKLMHLQWYQCQQSLHPLQFDVVPSLLLQIPLHFFILNLFFINCNFFSSFLPVARM